ncbi:toll/interleukin-1 receptor domain-containing protein [Deinococcus sp. MIMF12]|uniref:Toll/interleukin-1 receptor domain-containing protein n=1 Tax=Deinococcus rhizophilus TaxID=3049544 RepID=A0ABT7JHV2_9DEIO|nr:toll/interleukin-1 receptor domain-containing protein [Deinococcus rhizophilus]MDL2344638.1 toll/interleukin-1 receptor domain-containing protein [Deinococcus rhizophilus]
MTWRDELARHLEGLQPVLRRRTPERFDKSGRAERLKADIQTWNRRAVQLLGQAPQGAKVVAEFRALGHMRFTTLKDVQAQLRLRGQVVERLLGTAGRGTPPPKHSSLKIRKRSAGSYRYAFCLTFAGEDREFAAAVNRGLRRRRYPTFFDQNKEARTRLLGEAGPDVLHEVFYRESELCLMFVSRAYKENVWPGVERRSAQARDAQQGGGYIIPIRIDETELPGMPHTIGYLQKRQGAARIVGEVIDKLKAARAGRGQPPGTSPAGPTRTKSRPAPKRTTGHLVLLEDHVYFAHQVRRGDDLTVEVKAKTQEQLARLRTIGEKKGSWTTIPFAEHLTGRDVQVVDYEEVTDRAGRTTVTLQLRPSRNASSGVHFGVPAQESEHLIRQVLTGRPPITGWTTLPTDVQQGVVALAARSRGSPAETAQLAQLLAVYSLQKLGLVAAIRVLDVRARRRTVAVEFTGEIRTGAFGQTDSEIRLREVVPLPDR